MSNELAAAVTDAFLFAATIFFAIELRSRNQLWAAVFFSLAMAALLGSLFHGIGMFHSQGFWTLVSAFAVASAFLFLMACISITYPRAYIKKAWPLVGLAGFLLGVGLSTYPFYVISMVSGVCLILAALVLHKAKTRARKWIWIGMILTVIGLICQKFVHGQGLASPNAIFHYFQILANYFFWSGAKRA